MQLLVNWRKLDIENPPSCPGIYAIASETRSKWFYVGKSQNIAKRIVAKNHPVQVTRDIKLSQYYFYVHVEKEYISQLEHYLIKKHDPEWNGSTSFDSNSPWACCQYHCFGIAEQEMLLAAIG